MLIYSFCFLVRAIISKTIIFIKYKLFFAKTNILKMFPTLNIIAFNYINIFILEIKSEIILK